MRNGDRITCEIRSLDQGQLTVKQVYASSTVIFDWGNVDHIQTQQSFVVVDNRGNATSGSISEAAAEHIVNVDGAVSGIIPHNEVVSIRQTGETFVRRLRGDIKFYKDFYVRASSYDNYDNQPVVGAPPNNLGLSSTVGRSFRQQPLEFRLLRKPYTATERHRSYQLLQCRDSRLG